MLTDLRRAARALLRTPGFTAAAVLCIALGVGANAAVLGAVDAVLLHPLPTPALDRLVVLRDNLPTLNMLDADVSPAEAHDLAARTDLFEASTAFAGGNLTLSGAGPAERLSAVRTTGDFFRVFGTRPAVGRFYAADDSWRGRHRVAVLSYGFWQERFGGDRGIVGRTLRLNGEPYEVVGVLPREFRYPRSGQLWVPYAMDSAALGNRGMLNMTAVARLRPEVTPERLAAGLRDERQRWRQRFPGPDSYADFGHALSARPLVDFIAGQLRPVLLMLTGAVALVLLIACANVASLQLVRAGARARALAVHAALGAAGARLARGPLLESALLAVAGGALGVGIAALAVRLLARWAPDQQAALQGARLSPTVLALTAVATGLAGVLFAAYPALRAARVDPQDVLKQSARGASAAGPRQRLLDGVVVVQVALTFVLLLGAGLLLRSLGAVLATDPGFRTEQLVTARVTVPRDEYPSDTQRVAAHDALLARLGALPGVQSVALASSLPLGAGDDSSPFRIVGDPTGPDAPKRHASLRQATPGYFRALGIPLLRGRTFAESDALGAPEVAVIDEALARQYFPGQDPIGRQIDQGRPATIVGVVGATRYEELGKTPYPAVYYATAQRPWLATMTVVLRTPLPLASVAPALRRAVAEVDADIPVFDLATMTERVARSEGTRRLTTAVLGGFAALSLALALCGLYGVLSYATSERRQELGIRSALGATAGDIVRMVVAGGGRLVALGLAVGAAAFLVAGRALSTLLYGVGPRDPGTVLGSALVLAAAALLACYLPARRAARADPMTALRSD